MGVTIRQATLSDATTLAVLGAATFTDAFGHLYKAADLKAFTSEKHSERFYKNALSKPDTTLWLAEDCALALAYAMTAPNALPCDPPRSKALELVRLYAAKGHYGLGLGQTLMDRVISHAKAARHSDIVLSVFSDNEAGQRFYTRNGFSKIGEYGFSVGQQIDHEFIFCKPL